MDGWDILKWGGWTRATLLGLAWRPAAADNSSCEHTKNAVGDKERGQPLPPALQYLAPHQTL